MTISRFLKRLLNGDRAVAGSAASVRHAIAWAFIALVALFLTQPAGGTFGRPEMQVPWPVELGLDEGLVDSPSPLPSQGRR